MLEKNVENYLKDLLEQLGCKFLKFVSPGNRGVPDRIVLVPGGQTIFIEMKKPGEDLRPQQKLRIKEFKELGQVVLICQSVADAQSISRRMKYAIRTS